MAGNHALLSPSSADRWMLCPGSVAFCKDLPDEGSPYADEGTAAHWLAAECLRTETPVSRYAGLQIAVSENYVGLAQLGPVHMAFAPEELWIVTDEMVEAVTRYVLAIREAAADGQFLVEQRLPISQLTGEAEAGGATDAAVFVPRQLQVHDIKYGRGVEVSAVENRQLMIYALAALDEYSAFIDEVDSVKMVIHQPRVSSTPSEWPVGIEVLEEFREQLYHAAEATRADDAPRIPGEKQCKWCRGKATCPELAANVAETIGAGFEAIAEQEGTPPPDFAHPLHAQMAAVPLIEDWCKAVRAETERRLLARIPVPGYKLVQGKRGARAWTDEAAAEAAMKAMRLKQDEMYSYKVISPTAAEKLLKDSPRRWVKLESLITQSDGKPSVAPESDKRPALVLDVTDQFEDVS